MASMRAIPERLADESLARSLVLERQKNPRYFFSAAIAFCDETKLYVCACLRRWRVVQGRRHDVRDEVASYESDDNSAAVAATRHETLLRLGTTKSRLFVDCVRPSDAGVYTCIADTPTRRITTTVVLRVGQY